MILALFDIMMFPVPASNMQPVFFRHALQRGGGDQSRSSKSPGMGFF
jgi:hypothetical protein